MPLINGQKMACEPCIRGHRSTKCTHANERLMIPVRKPGRPLSSCPHPPTRGCGCGSVTAAIPRKQKCNCGSNSSAATHEHGNGNDLQTNGVDSAKPDAIKVESPVSEVPPASPAGMKPPTASSNIYRISKPTARANGRKQSFGPANLERIDPSQVNILPPYDVSQPAIASQLSNGIHNGHGASVPGQTLDYNQSPMMSPNPSMHNPMAYAMYQQPPMAPQMMHFGTANTPNMAAAGTPQKSVTLTTSNHDAPAAGRGSCCSGGSKAAKETPPASTIPSPKPTPIAQRGSCCSSKVPSEANSTTASGAATPLQATNGITMPPFQTPMPFNQQMYPAYFPQPTLFTYPPHYGSYLTPLQPAQWKQAMEALQMAQHQRMPQASFEVASPFLFDTNGGVSADGAQMAGTSHECTCGDGCQCVGCAAHPYNEATQDIIRSAWQSMNVEDVYHHSNGTNGLQTASSTQPTKEAHSSSLKVDSAAETQQAADASNSPAAPQTPSDAASATNEELPANDFFFVEYNFGSCLGETSSCPCGDDCQCIGCAIHNQSEVSVSG